MKQVPEEIIISATGADMITETRGINVSSYKMATGIELGECDLVVGEETWIGVNVRVIFKERDNGI